MATISASGAPDIVPVTFALVDDTVYTAVDHKAKTTRDLTRLANIRADERVTLLVDEYNEDWSKLWWCRLRGNAQVALEGKAFETGIETLTAKYEHYRRTRLRGPVIVISVTETTGWAALG